MDLFTIFRALMGWLEGWAQIELLTKVSTCHHSSMAVPGSSGFLHGGLGFSESVSKQAVEASPSLRPGVGNWHHCFCHIALLKGLREPPKFQGRGHGCQPSMGRMSRNIWPSIICHATTLRKTSTFLADTQALIIQPLMVLYHFLPLTSPSSQPQWTPPCSTNTVISCFSPRKLHTSCCLCLKYPSPNAFHAGFSSSFRSQFVCPSHTGCPDQHILLVSPCAQPTTIQSIQTRMF